MLVRFQIAERLGKTLAELNAMTTAEFIHWVAFYKLRDKARGYNESQN